MKKAVICHIEFRGIPLCDLGHESRLRFAWPTCGFESLASAKRELKKLQKLDWGFKIVRGECHFAHFSVS